jgi:hypothetical protein
LDIDKRDYTGPSLSTEQRIRYLVLRAGIGEQTFWIDWLVQVIAELDQLKDAGPCQC